MDAPPDPLRAALAVALGRRDVPAETMRAAVGTMMDGAADPHALAGLAGRPADEGGGRR